MVIYPSFRYPRPEKRSAWAGMWLAAYFLKDGADLSGAFQHQGFAVFTVHYLYKDENYNFHKAFALFKEIASQTRGTKAMERHYELALAFLRRCSEAGVFYE